ncbi:MAG: hypothetical protein JWO46_583 [Nocardioidaceae bacterium]|nr:hypothetical protein [Nocardioidaceae bacterium]
MSRGTRDRFHGRIAGLGSSSGVRVVVGRWDHTPLGRFADVMLAEPDGTRVLLAPDDEVAEFVAATYTFDRVETGPVTVVGDEHWRVSAPGLEVGFDVGTRLPLGRLLRAVPGPLAVAPAWSAVTDPIARRVMHGVRTRGTAGNGRREYYGATDLRRITASHGSWRDQPLGTLADVDPEPGFGFGSTPRTPSVTWLVTTIEWESPTR